MEYRITLRPVFLNHDSSVPDPNWKNGVVKGAERSRTGVFYLPWKRKNEEWGGEGCLMKNIGEW